MELFASVQRCGNCMAAMLGNQSIEKGTHFIIARYVALQSQPHGHSCANKSKHLLPSLAQVFMFICSLYFFCFPLSFFLSLFILLHFHVIPFPSPQAFIFFLLSLSLLNFLGLYRYSVPCQSLFPCNFLSVGLSACLTD